MFKWLFSGWKILRPIPGNNCVDWMNAHVKRGDVIVYGRYLPEPNLRTNHVWIVRNGKIYDNLHPGGVPVGDKRYKRYFDIDRHNTNLRKLLNDDRGLT